MASYVAFEDGVACELHEGRAWAECVTACSQVAGNPLGAELIELAGISVPVLSAVDFWLFNRLIGFGVADAATEDDVDAVQRVYSERSQTQWAVGVPPFARPLLADWLVARGLRHTGDFAKVIRTTEEPVEVTTTLRIEEIGADRAVEFAGINVAAWGVPDTFAAWFGATVGRPNWLHYIAFDNDIAVSTGALYMSDGIGWLGFGATLPTHRNRGGQGALMARRIRDARDNGCRLVHTETAAETPDQPNPSYRNMLRTGFTLAYLRPNYVSQPSP